jgi:hypothetical protein
MTTWKNSRYCDEGDASGDAPAFDLSIYGSPNDLHFRFRWFSKSACALRTDEPREGAAAAVVQTSGKTGQALDRIGMIGNGNGCFQKSELVESRTGATPSRSTIVTVPSIVSGAAGPDAP